MQVDTGVTLTQIGQIAIPVQDLGRAVDFYQERLRMRYLFTAGTLAFFECGRVRLMLTVPESAEAKSQSSVLYYAVDDIHNAYRELEARGVHFDDSPHHIADMGPYELWMAFFRDSEDNSMAIMGEIPHGT